MAKDSEMKIDTSNQGHARLSASQTKTWTECPGSVAWLETQPESGGTSEYAMLGTCAHALIEKCLEEGEYPDTFENRIIKIVDPEHGAGTSMLQKGAKMPISLDAVVFIVDQDMIEATTKMVEYIQDRCFQLGLTKKVSAKAVAKLVKTGAVRLEVKVNPLPDRDDTGGSCDVVIDAWPDVMEVVDYKHGQGVFVSVVDNPQTKSYLLGSMLAAGISDYDKAIHTICQPRHVQSPADGIMLEEILPAELLEWQSWLGDRARVVDECREFVSKGANLDELHHKGYLSVGKDGSHCTFCNMKTKCPAAISKAQEVAMVDFDDEPFEIDTPGENLLAVVYPWLPFLKEFIKSVEIKASTVMLAGGGIENHKLVHGRSSRKFRGSVKYRGTDVDLDDDMKATILSVRYGISKEHLYHSPKFITGPQTEKLIKQCGGDVEAFNNDMLVKSTGRLTVVHESDSRAEVLIGDAGSDFESEEL